MDDSELRSLLPLVHPTVFSETMQAVGNTLWRIQLLDEGVQHDLVTRYGVEKGFATEVAQTRLEKSRKKTLGQLLVELKGAPRVSDELSAQLSAFVPL